MLRSSLSSYLFKFNFSWSLMSVKMKYILSVTKMRILTLSLLIILTLVSESISVDLKCLEGGFRTCQVNYLVITSPYDKITSVNGKFETLDDYDALIIQNQRVNFVPQNIANFFPQLTQLEILNSSLEWIEQENIKDLVHLTELNLEKNKIEILEKNLFDFNTKLETINISENQLRFVHKDIFYRLNELRSINLEHNSCIQDYNYYRQYFEQYYNYKNEIVDQLQRHCQSSEKALNINQRINDKKINILQSEIRDLTHRLATCDGNLNAALTNYRQQKLMNSNIESRDEPIDSKMIFLPCLDVECKAIVFKVPFANSSIESGNFYKDKDLDITSVYIHQQQTLFLPNNLAEQFPSLNELTVIECGLCEIDYSVLGRLNLWTLKLSKNKIPEIPVDTFADLENLQELDLSFNRIQSLHDGVFSTLKKLQILYLNNNYLTSVNAEVLKHLVSLSNLFLQNNRLRFIGASLLTPFTSLELLDLSHNVCIDMIHPKSSLIDIEATIIDNCIAPVEFNCEMVKIESTENVGHYCQAEDLFIEYPKTKISKLTGVEPNDTVKTLFVHKQSIKFFAFQLSHQLPNLRRIEIQQSNLTALHQADFAGFSELIEIVINGNNLSSSISQGTFDTVTQLELLDLSSNNIVSLPTNIFAKLTHIHTLLLSNNQIVRFAANLLPRKNLIETFRVDNNQLEFIETKTIRFLRKAKLIVV